MRYVISISRSLTAAGVLFLAFACDHTSGLLQTTSLLENGAPLDLEKDKCINMTYPVQEIVLGAVVDPDDLMELGWNDTSVNACCLRQGTGTLQVTSMTDNGTVYRSYPSTCRLPPLPLPEAPRSGRWANVSEPFRILGRTVEGLSFTPNDLALQQIGNALLAKSLEADASTAEHFPVFANVGDIGFMCERAGEGSVQVSFSDGGASPIEYSLTCQGHDQGGGG
jgi:hypothetical protein